MRSALALLVPLLLAGCATREPPFAPVAQVDYTAVGHDPFWMVTIGDASIVLTLGAEEPGGRKSDLRTHSVPRVLPRTDGTVTRWESGEGTAVIAIEARHGPCTGARGLVYREHVTISLSGRQLTGCGGRLVGRGI
ncbi:hypothetical protein E2493_13195 [Sphingomonas parva]|uniref:Lipoprotein n=1 Tax=Sphingomonas parva TaxID=2555898 RepID=A0A4Y8ZSL3_9SPHN|nr:hypothetical protein [Sphingomonas parva]TFI57779.1 hypothetical protein E2493_13195 [Sphingomonas parva]